MTVPNNSGVESQWVVLMTTFHSIIIWALVSVSWENNNNMSSLRWWNSAVHSWIQPPIWFPFNILNPYESMCCSLDVWGEVWVVSRRLDLQVVSLLHALDGAYYAPVDAPSYERLSGMRFFRVELQILWGCDFQKTSSQTINLTSSLIVVGSGGFVAMVLCNFFGKDVVKRMYGRERGDAP